MMFTCLSCLAFIVFTLVNLQVNAHALAITRGTMDRGVKVLWSLLRTGCVIALLLLIVLAGLAGVVQSLLLFIASMAAFSFLFRRGINVRMKWDEHYLGVSSWYDLFWLRLFCRPSDPRKPSLRWFVDNHYGRYGFDWNYRRAVWHAEKSASAAEIGCCMLCIAGAILLQGA